MMSQFYLLSALIIIPFSFLFVHSQFHCGKQESKAVALKPAEKAVRDLVGQECVLKLVEAEAGNLTPFIMVYDLSNMVQHTRKLSHKYSGLLSNAFCHVKATNKINFLEVVINLDIKQFQTTSFPQKNLTFHQRVT